MNKSAMDRFLRDREELANLERGSSGPELGAYVSARRDATLWGLLQMLCEMVDLLTSIAGKAHRGAREVPDILRRLAELEGAQAGAVPMTPGAPGAGERERLEAIVEKVLRGSFIEVADPDLIVGTAEVVVDRVLSFETTRSLEFFRTTKADRACPDVEDLVAAVAREFSHGPDQVVRARTVIAKCFRRCETGVHEDATEGPASARNTDSTTGPDRQLLDYCSDRDLLAELTLRLSNRVTRVGEADLLAGALRHIRKFMLPESGHRDTPRGA